MSILLKKGILVALQSVLMVVVVLLGYYVGRYTTVRPFKKYIKEYSYGETMGSFLNKKQQDEISNVYYDSKLIIPQFDDISWAVPNIPTPFVGNGPLPGKHANVYINSMQFRSKNEIVLPKHENSYRIFITGGSTAYSIGAPSQDRTIAGYLERILNDSLTHMNGINYEVITAANPAWASTHERIFIENRLSELEPDMVISFSGNNDVHWGRKGRNIFWFRTMVDDYFFSLIKTVYSITGQSQLPELITISSESINPDIVAKRLCKNIRLSLFSLAEKQIDYVFVLQPNYNVTKKKLVKRLKDRQSSDNKEYHRKCYSLIDKNISKIVDDRFWYLNLSGVFDRLKATDEIFIDSYHFGDKGNEIVAKSIFSYIKPIITK